MSARRDVQEAGRNARKNSPVARADTCPETGADKIVVRVKYEKAGAGAETSEVLGMEALVKRDSDGSADWLRDFGLNTYNPVVRRLGMDHHIRAARVKKWARNRLDKTEDRDWIKARIWKLSTDLPFDGGLGLLRLERVARDVDETLRRPRVKLSGKWRYATAGGGRSVDEQRGEARDRQKQDKVQDAQGGTRAKTGC